MNDRSCFVNISDGGHMENLGVHELLRRRCKFIVVIDGECDAALQCGALARLMRLAKLDFQIDIDLDVSRFQPEKPGGPSPYHFALGEIRYPGKKGEKGEKQLGFLLYIKLSVTGNESLALANYKLRNPDFPHQTTADQVFDEEQFEAYRALGEHAASDLFTKELITPGSVDSMADWFHYIAASLQDPYQN
ncbi:MAG: hypothetical protein ACKOU6_08150, partial [Planctomycetota bacterium]